MQKNYTNYTSLDSLNNKIKTDLENLNLSKSSKIKNFLTNNIIAKNIRKLFLFISYIKQKFDNWLDTKERKLNLRKFLEEPNSFEEWKSYALELDKLEGKEIWKNKKETKLYDWKEVEKLIKTLKKKREIKDIYGIVHYIRVNLMKNLYSTMNPVLFQVCNFGTKYLIEEYQEEMLKSLDFIANFNEQNFPLYKKIEFFSETRHSYGRTALLLSGGASMGMYHSGVIKTLWEQNLLPRIICGSSAGSIAASVLCTETYDKVGEFIDKELKLGPFEFQQKKSSFLRRIMRYLSRGVLLDVEVLKEFIRENIGDITFQEAYDKTGWILNITVTGYKEHDNHRLLNYLTAPNVLIWSASCASSCVPGLFEPVELMCKNEYGHIVPYSSDRKKFIDGSISADLPMQRLSELFNVNIFLVSQTNPWVIPFLDQDDGFDVFSYEKKRINFWKLLKNLLYSELRHRFMQIKALGLLPNYFANFLNIFTQDYHGHVTIFPVPKLIDYFKIITNPSKQFVAEASLHSSRRTYPKISFIDNILKFELALERHHKKLKSRINKLNFNFSSEKKYELDGEDCLDSFNYKNILQEENSNFEEKNLNEIINIKTDYFTNNSNNIKEIHENNITYTSNEDRISDSFNNLLFNKENKRNLYFEYTDGVSDRKFSKEINPLKKIDISSIDPSPSDINALSSFKKRKVLQNRKSNIQPGNNNNVNFKNVISMRNGSFSLPRNNSRKFQIFKTKKNMK